MTRPLVSFAMLTYNQARYIDAALAAALAQTYQPLEILIGDDFSRDGTWERVQSLVSGYGGPHNIKLIRPPANTGLANNINRVFGQARGKYIIAAAGDDISLPERTAKIVETFQGGGENVHCVLGDAAVIDGAGAAAGAISGWAYDAPPNELALLKPNDVALCGAAAAYSSEIFRRFGPLDPRTPHEDHPMAFRAILLGQIVRREEKLVQYRRHDTNLSRGRPEHEQSVESLRAIIRERCREDRLLFDQKAADLDRALAFTPLPPERLERLMRLRRRYDAALRLYQRLLDHPLAGLPSAAYALAVGRTGRTDLLKWMAARYAPGLWLAHVRRGLR